MAKNANFVSHKKSKQIVNGKPKLPLATDLVEGEIAINFGKDVETLSIKNESGDVVTFSSDNYFINEKSGFKRFVNPTASTNVGLVNSLSQYYDTNIGKGAVIEGDGYEYNGTIHNIVASGGFSHAEGLSTSATSRGSHAEGQQTTASGSQSHAEGAGTKASGDYSHAEGVGTIASVTGSHAEGQGTTASGQFSHAEGQGTTASGYYSHAEGQSTTASGYYSHAEGQGTMTIGSFSHAEGQGTQASGIYSHAEGYYTRASGNSSHAEGQGTQASGSSSHAEGEGTLASGACSHAEGKSTQANGIYSHAEGQMTTASGNSSHAEGQSTTANGGSSHAEGQSTQANGSSSHAEGYYTTASGSCSHTEGQGTQANGSSSHAEGYYTTASGSCSHTEGNYTTASGDYSHAEGQSTTASGSSSHAECVGTIASGQYSHAEGNYTTASGSSSHAEGTNTIASGDYSHTEGYNTITYNKAEHASGQYNVSSSASTTFGDSGNTLFSVGNGTTDNVRHNAFEIRQNGDIYIVNKDGDDVRLQDEIGNIDVDQVLDDTTSASTNPVSSKAVYKAVTDNELVWTNAFVALSGTVSAHTENTEIHVTAADKEKLHTHTNKTYLDSITGNVGTMAYQNANSYSSATEVQTALSGKANTATTLAGYGIADAYTKSETSGKTEIENALNAKANTTDLANFFDDAKYEDSGNTKVINFYHGNTIKATIDASDFIVDGMVDDVKIENGYLVIDFNTASGKQDISIPLTDIFDPSNYYNKTAIDNLVGSGFTSSSITDVIIENEEIVSNALTDLDERKLDATAYTPTDLSNYYTKSETSGNTEIQTALNGKVDTTAFTNHTGSSVHMTTTEKTNLDSLATNIAAISGITSTKVDNWDTAYTNNHTHSNKTALDSITGSVGTMAYQDASSYSSATEVQTALSGKQHVLTEGRAIDIADDVISLDLPISASTGVGSIVEGRGTTASGDYSHAEGNGAKANGHYSHAEGYNTTASGNSSHAEGGGTTASGAQSHAEGRGTTASGDYSHAEGINTTASGAQSHAEGGGTQASGNFSHAEGASTQASGYYSHAEGVSTQASGDSSHAEGYYTEAKNESEHASGRYNVSSSASTTFGDSGNTLFSVGNGTADNARHNAFEIRQNGDIYIVSGNTDILLQDHLGGSDITVDQVIDSGTSASTNAVATKAVYEVITNIEDIVGSGYTSSSITDVIESRDQAIAAALNYLNSKGVVSAVTVSSNLNNVVCPNQILGNEMSGAQAAVVYVNSGTTTDYTITVSTTYKTPDGNQLNLTCPKNGYCEISYLNINGTIYARGI